ncbi:MAG: CPBP family intramembrane metalloprotease [Bacilli bacterium]|nr:CPBP family intramembrane metalloprotease [Bacilli bacterium]
MLEKLQLTKQGKTILKAILTFLIFWYGAYVQVIPIQLFHIDTKNLSDKNAVILSTFSSIIIAIIFFFLYRKDLKKEWKTFKEKLGENMSTGFACWIIGLVLMVVFNLIFMLVFHTEGAKNENLIQEMIKAFPSLMLLDAGILAPFNEEIAFRKTLKDVFLKYKWIGILASFLLFGIAHVINNATVWTDYLFIISYGSLGATFSYAYYKTDTVFTSMAMHMIHNIALISLSILI